VIKNLSTNFVDYLSNIRNTSITCLFSRTLKRKKENDRSKIYFFARQWLKKNSLITFYVNHICELELSQIFQFFSRLDQRSKKIDIKNLFWCQFHQHLRARFSYKILAPKPKHNLKSCQKGRFIRKICTFNVDEIDPWRQIKLFMSKVLIGQLSKTLLNTY